MFADVKMRGVNGFQLLKFVRAHKEATDHVKVVMLSSSESPKDKALTVVLGATRYLVKFPPPQVLVEIIAAACKP